MVFKLIRVDSEDPKKIKLQNGKHFIGRGKLLDCEDKRVSRKHGELEVSKDTVSVKALHQNPCFYIRKGSTETEVLKRDSLIYLVSGDKFGLLPDTHWYELLHNEDTEPSESSSNSMDTKSEACADNTQIVNEDNEKEIGDNSATNDNPIDFNLNENQNDLEMPESPSLLTSENTTQQTLRQPESSITRPIKAEIPESTIGNEDENTKSQIPEPTIGNEDENTKSQIPEPTIGNEDENTKSQIPEPTIGNEDENTKSQIPEPTIGNEDENTKLPLRRDSSELLDAPEPTVDNDDVKTRSPLKRSANELLNDDDNKRLKINPNLQAVKNEPEDAKAGPSNDQGSGDAPKSPVKPQPPLLRERCIYGANCYRKNPAHKAQFSHPSDSDWGTGDRGECPWGAHCSRRDPRHWQHHTHPPGTQPPPPPQQQPGMRMVQRHGNIFYINAHTVNFYDDHFQAEDSDGDSVDYDYEF